MTLTPRSSSCHGVLSQQPRLLAPKRVQAGGQGGLAQWALEVRAGHQGTYELSSGIRRLTEGLQIERRAGIHHQLHTAVAAPEPFQ